MSLAVAVQSEWLDFNGGVWFQKYNLEIIFLKPYPPDLQNYIFETIPPDLQIIFLKPYPPH